MLQNISTVSCLIYAVCIGFVFAIIYTNIQRSAMSKFIEYLVNNAIDSEENAVTLGQIGLKGIGFSIVKSGIKNQYGLKSAINTVNVEKDDDLSLLSPTSDTKNRYYLSGECDKEALLKKYSYKKMSVKFMCFFIVAIILTAIVASFFTDKIVSGISSSNTSSDKSNLSQETNQEENVSYESDKKTQTNKSETENDSTFDDVIDDSGNGEISAPRLPIGGNNQ